MAARFGVVLYWLFTAIAAMLALIGGVVLLFGDEMIVGLAYLAPAVIAWGIGWAVRYALAGK